MIKNIFPIPIYEAFLESFNSIKFDILKDTITHVESLGKYEHPHAQGGMIATPGEGKFKLENISYGSVIETFVNEHLKIYWNQLHYTEDFEPYIVNCWATRSTNGASWGSHAHPPFPLAGVFYVNASPEQGNIVFESPLEILLGCQPIKDIGTCPFFEHTEDAISGKLLLFPGWLKHKVQSNPTDNPRVIFGFDIGQRPVKN